MTRAIPTLVLGALVVIGGALTYLMSQVPLPLRGVLAAMLLLFLMLGPFVAHIVRQTVIYRTAKLEHERKSPARRTSTLCQTRPSKNNSQLRVVHDREQGGGQRRL